MTTKKYDYSKYPTENLFYDYDTLKDEKFFGVHIINERVEVDVDRYIEACKLVGIEDFIPDDFKTKYIHQYFVPRKQEKYDYFSIIMRDGINRFEKDWEQEYKPIFSKIKTPSEVKEQTRLDALMYTSNSDDFDEIDIDAMMAGIRRQNKYNQIINEMYCMFINKLCTEVDRITLIALSAISFDETSFSVGKFKTFADGLASKANKNIKFKDLDGYNSYNMLHEIHNFLKHNSIDAYTTLKNDYPKNVRSKENGNADKDYENGMFAGDWIIIKEGYIEKAFKKLHEFFNCFSKNYLDEIDDSWWNNDDYFYDALSQMSNPAEYYGL